MSNTLLGYPIKPMPDSEPKMPVPIMLDAFLPWVPQIDAAELKLYAFRPCSHGPLSYFVVALSEEDALLRVNISIDFSSGKLITSYAKRPDGIEYWECEADYELKVYDIGAVATNTNK